MNRRNIFLVSYIASIVIVILGAYLKITHNNSGDTILTAAIAVTLVYIIIGIFEVGTSRKISTAEKVLWMIGFIFMSGVTGLIYLLVGRKRVVANTVEYSQ